MTRPDRAALLLVALLLCGVRSPAATSLPERTPIRTVYGPLAGPPGETLTVDLPPAERQENWGGGSCVHASMVSLFRWQGRPELAEHWRRTYGDGETVSGLRAKLDREGVPYADTTAGDVAFLEWSVRTRRGAAVVVMHGAHMVTLVDFNEREAVLLDNNDPTRLQRVPRDRFVSEWRRSSGWAVTPLFDPPPRKPW